MKKLDESTSDSRFEKAEVRPNRKARRRMKKNNNNKKGNAREYDARKTSSNDPSWYSQSPELLRDSSSIPFSWPVGTSLDTSSKVMYDRVPGIMRVDLTPTIGTSLSKNSPVNVAASAIYSWVRHANSGHSNYDAPDLMMYLLAMSNIYSLVTWMQRLYGYASMYDQRNRYLPSRVVEASDVDFDDLRNNLANFRYFLNAFINKVASLAVPNTMPIFNRLAFLYSNVYIEGPSIKDQLYMYHPYNLEWYKFEINESTSMGELVRVAMSRTGTGNKAKVSDIMTYATTLFEAIWEQEDFGIMSGDIIKAYDSNVIKLAPVPEEMNMVPVYDALVLHQMKNVKTMGELEISKISQSAAGEILQSIILNTSVPTQAQEVTYQACMMNKILSTDFDNPTPEVVIESTRLMPAYSSYKGVVFAGTELPRVVRFFTINKSEGLSYSGNSATAVTKGTSVSTSDFEAVMSLVAIASAFRYAPEIIIWITNSASTVLEGQSYRVWDIDNYAVLDNSDLEKMHEAALLSLFAVPAISKIS